MRWNWKHQLAGIVLVSALVFAVIPSKETPKAKFERAQNQTVLLTDDGGGQASGFVVERENFYGEPRVFIWTAAHVVRDAPELNVTRHYHFQSHKAGQSIFKARVVAFSVKHDLALMLADIPPGFFPSTSFASSPACLGDPVFVVGNSLGAVFDGSVHLGNVSQISVDHGKDWIWGIPLDQTTAIIVPGNSGGPVFNVNGKVIGVAVGWARLPGIGMYVPLNRIHEWTTEAGLRWAVYGHWCPDDKQLEDNIVVARKLLLPPPPPPPPPAPKPDPIGPGVPQPDEPPVHSSPISP